MKALVLLLYLASTCWCKPTTVVNFGPVGDAPGIAPGFAYAFRAPAPLYKASSITPGSHPVLTAPITNHITAPEEAPTILKTQYHSQDLLGQYAFGYVGDASTAHEVRTSDGAVRGSYTYLDANGELQTANYVADNNGFRVEATNLPLAPTAPEAPKMLLPEPVKPTPEVEAATAAHLKAVAEIKASRNKRSSEPSSTKGYLPPALPAAKKESSYVPAPAKPETVAVKYPLKKKYKLPVPLKKVLSEPVPLTISHLPVPLSVPASPVVVTSHQSPIPLSHVLPQAIFVKADPQALQSLSLTPVLHPAVLSPIPSVSIAPSHVLSQFHAQDELGGYEYGYEGGPSSKHEVHTPDGVTRGSYSYVDANGELQTVSYVADDVSGFRVLATNLPEAPAEPF